MSHPSIILRQNNVSFESRTVAMACMLDGTLSQLVNFEDLPSHSIMLRQSLPVGSVEFLRECMNLAGIPEPENLSYPKEILPFLGREIQLSTVAEVKSRVGRTFIKPTKTKAWTGFVLDSSKQSTDYDEHDLEQFNAFQAMSLTESVWTSECVNFVSEWRYYIRGRRSIGSARYDPDGLDNAPSPNEEVVRKCIDALPFDHPYALDMGVLDTGETVCVEVNDAFALGLYGRALTPVEYVDYLWERWSGLVA